jgi:hypothetical protein
VVAARVVAAVVAATVVLAVVGGSVVDTLVGTMVAALWVAGGVVAGEPVGATVSSPQATSNNVTRPRFRPRLICFLRRLKLFMFLLFFTISRFGFTCMPTAPRQEVTVFSSFYYIITIWFQNCNTTNKKAFPLKGKPQI